MTISSFVVKTDADTGIHYIMKNEDALTKNHRTDKENFTGFMAEERGSIYCPVASYETYVSKLNTKCDRLWQYPRDTYCEEDNEWFCNKPVGRDALAAYDKAIKNKCGLSQNYTNNTVKATFLKFSNYGCNWS